MSPVTWSLLFPDGRLKQDTGYDPPDGWFNDVRACLGLALLFPGYPPLYAVRPRCSNDVDLTVFGDGSRKTRRLWGVKPEPGSEVWFYPDARMIGMGRDTNEVERLVLAFQGKLRVEEVARAPDQRGRPESLSSR